MRLGSPFRKAGRYYVGCSPTQNNTSTAPKTVPPGGAKAGDILIAVIQIGGVQTITNVPAGWALVDSVLFNASGASFSVYWKLMQSDAVDFSWTLSGSVNWTVITYAFRHIDQITPIVDADVQTANVASSATATLPAITTTVKNILIGIVVVQGSRIMQSQHALFRRTAVENILGAILLIYTEPTPPAVNPTFNNTLSSAAAHGLLIMALRVVM